MYSVYIVPSGSCTASSRMTPWAVWVSNVTELIRRVLAPGLALKTSSRSHGAHSAHSHDCHSPSSDGSPGRILFLHAIDPALAPLITIATTIPTLAIAMPLALVALPLSFASLRTVPLPMVKGSTEENNTPGMLTPSNS